MLPAAQLPTLESSVIVPKTEGNIETRSVWEIPLSFHALVAIDVRYLAGWVSYTPMTHALSLSNTAMTGTGHNHTAQRHNRVPCAGTSEEAFDPMCASAEVLP
jgi:hypothetical protein